MTGEKVHTHYDNLKVTRNAPPEVIRAAYRAMAQKFHPDVNPSPDAARVMSIINEAWEVLSDPDRRRLHDQWILKEEALASREAPPSSSQAHAAAAATASSPEAQPSKQSPERRQRIVRLGVVAAIVVAVLVLIASQQGTPPDRVVRYEQAVEELFRGQPRQIVGTPYPSQTITPQERGTVKSSEHGAIRPSAPEPEFRPVSTSEYRHQISRLDPGERIPSVTGYIINAPRLNQSGLSEVTIDNTGNESDVVVKLCDAAFAHCHAVRKAFISAGTRFTFKSIAEGDYDVRYVDLNSAAINKSTQIRLLQVQEETGTRYSAFTLTLYTVVGGNTRMQRIDPKLF